MHIEKTQAQLPRQIEKPLVNPMPLATARQQLEVAELLKKVQAVPEHQGR